MKLIPLQEVNNHFVFKFVGEKFPKKFEFEGNCYKVLEVFGPVKEPLLNCMRC